MNHELIQKVCDRWADPSRRPLFKGSLIDASGCCCAQGDILRTDCGWSDDDLRAYGAQDRADAETAKTLGISRMHAIMLRQINDSADGCPEDVLLAPEKLCGEYTDHLLAFGRHMDAMTKEQWHEVAAREAAWSAAGEAAWSAVWSAAWEIIGAKYMRERGHAFYFLPMFGVADPEAVLAQYPNP